MHSDTLCQLGPLIILNDQFRRARYTSRHNVSYQSGSIYNVRYLLHITEVNAVVEIIVLIYLLMWHFLVICYRVNWIFISATNFSLYILDKYYLYNATFTLKRIYMFW